MLSENHAVVAAAYGFLLCDVTITISLSRNGWFHYTPSTWKLVSGSELGVFGSMVGLHWLFNCFCPIWRSTNACKKLSTWEVLVEVKQSREITSCALRESHHVCINFGGDNCPVCPFLVAALSSTECRVKQNYACFPFILLLFSFSIQIKCLFEQSFGDFVKWLDSSYKSKRFHWSSAFLQKMWLKSSDCKIVVKSDSTWVTNIGYRVIIYWLKSRKQSDLLL